MKRVLSASALALTLIAGVAVGQTAAQTAAQTSTETTTTQTAPSAIVPPPEGTLSTTHTRRAIDAQGNSVESESTTYRNDAGVARDSRTITRTMPAPPPTTTTTTTSSSSTTERR